MAKLQKKKKKKKRFKIKKVKPLSPDKKFDNSNGYFDETTLSIDNVSSMTEILNKSIQTDKKNISLNTLLKTESFKNKISRLKNRLLQDKSIKGLLDFDALTKGYKRYTVDDDNDEIDILLREIILFLKKRLATSRNVSYKDYQKIDLHLNNIKNLYNVFKNEGNTENLMLEIDKIISADKFIRYYIF